MRHGALLPMPLFVTGSSLSESRPSESYGEDASVEELERSLDSVAIFDDSSCTSQQKARVEQAAEIALAYVNGSRGSVARMPQRAIRSMEGSAFQESCSRAGSQRVGRPRAQQLGGDRLVSPRRPRGQQRGSGSLSSGRSPGRLVIMPTRARLRGTWADVDVWDRAGAGAATTISHLANHGGSVGIASSASRPQEAL